MNLEFSKKASIWAVIAVLVLIVGGYFGIYQGLNYMSRTAQALSQNKQTYQLQQDRLEKLQAFQSKIDQARSTINLLSEALPTETETASSASILDFLASKAGAKLVSFVRTSDNNEESLFEEGGKTTGPQTARETIEISLTGRYPKISKFIESLSTSRRPFSVSNIQLTETGANISLSSYYLSSN